MATSRFARSSFLVPRLAAFSSSAPTGPLAGRPHLASAETPPTLPAWSAAADAARTTKTGEGWDWEGPPTSSWRFGFGAAVGVLVARSVSYLDDMHDDLYVLHEDLVLARMGYSHLTAPRHIPKPLRPRPGSQGGRRPFGSNSSGDDKKGLKKVKVKVKKQEAGARLEGQVKLKKAWVKIEQDQKMILHERELLVQQRAELNKDRLLLLEREVKFQQARVRLEKHRTRLEKQSSKNKVERQAIEFQQQELEREMAYLEQEKARLSKQTKRSQKDAERIHLQWLQTLDLKIDNLLSRLEKVAGLPGRLVLLKKLAVEHKNFVCATIMGWYNTTLERFHEPLEDTAPEPPSDYFG